MLRRRASENPATLTSSKETTTGSHYSHDVFTTTTLVKTYHPETGNKLINNFMILQEIGRGVHGKVKLAQDIYTNELVAIKIVDKKNRRRQMGYSLLRGSQAQGSEPASRESEDKIRREIAILSKCNHPNVVRLYEVIDDPTSRKIYMALEYTANGEIEWRDAHDKPVMTLQEARRIFRDITCGLDYLHYQGIIHRDIKPANLLLSHDHIAKISDFGVSYHNDLLAVNNQALLEAADEKVIQKIDRELAETAGTPAFFAPELCCAGETVSISTSSTISSTKKLRISKAVDVWALGVTLYCFVFGQCPFVAATEFELFDTIPTQPLRFPAGFDLDPELQDLLEKLLVKNPHERITLDQVKVHPWVVGDLSNKQEWLMKSDPRYYLIEKPQELETPEHTGIMERLRQSIRKLSFSFGSNNRRRSSKQFSSPLTTPRHTYSTHNHSMHRHSQPIISKQPSYSKSLLPHTTNSVTPTVSLSTGHTLILNSGLHSSIIPSPSSPTTIQPAPLQPISYLSEDDSSSSIIDEEEDEEYHLDEGRPSRPDISRRVSSSSSSSGIAFGTRYRNQMTQLTPLEVMTHK
ncbi:kinase-like domain-containing protein [Blakeslea trispora]|nr:kinase-like domain-containing protein [Blakeslea trispora]